MYLALFCERIRQQLHPCSRYRFKFLSAVDLVSLRMIIQGLFHLNLTDSCTLWNTLIKAR